MTRIRESCAIFCIAVSFVISPGCQRAASGADPRLVRDFEKLGHVGSTPEEALTFRVRFKSPDRPLTRGIWPFVRERLEVEYCLVNEGETTLYIEPPHFAVPVGNPTVMIYSEDGGKPLFPRPWDPTPDPDIVGLLRIPPKDSVSEIVDVLADHTFPLERGKGYLLRAQYGSSYFLVTDTSGKRESWGGVINSNDLRFEY